jgi:hypothetical protein
MFKQARSRILFSLLLLAAPLTVCAQSAESEARFSVEPSDPGMLYGVGIKGESFKFTAYVTGAKCYALDFDDGTVEKVPDDDGIALAPDDRAVFVHPYAEVGNYFAKMRAWSDPDCVSGELPPVFTLEVRVKTPPSVRQLPPSIARFTVAQSEPGVAWADFTFSARVSQAQSYKLDFGDGVVASDIEPDLAGEAVRWRHVYKEPKVYTAKMTAERNMGEAVEIELEVSVQAPPPVAAVQWPPVRPVPIVRPERTKPDILPWLLLAAIALLLLQRSGLTEADAGMFDVTRDRGRFEVIGSPSAISMRVRQRKDPWFKISDDAVVQGVQPGRPASRVDS